MTTPVRTTGLRKRSEETRKRFAAERPYPQHDGAMLPLATVFQPVVFNHDQLSKPDCVGQAWTNAIEAHVRRRLSPTDLWTDARRRQGDLGNPLDGTDSEHAIASLINRGVSDYIPGEDGRSVDEDMELATVGQELSADDNRTPAAADHKVILIPRERPACDALQRNKAVCTGGGIRNVGAYSGMGTNQIADETILGGDADGHEQRVGGYIASDDTRFPPECRGCFMLVNSWGRWAGLVLSCDITLTDGSVLPAGTRLEGCVLITAAVLDGQWDCDSLDVLI